MLVGLTFWGEANNLDLRFSSEYFTDEKQWFLAKSSPWNWLYEYGEIPGIFFGLSETDAPPKKKLEHCKT